MPDAISLRHMATPDRSGIQFAIVLPISPGNHYTKKHRLSNALKLNT
jgi:hypothetical protein